MNEERSLPKAPKSKSFSGKRIAIVGAVCTFVILLVGIFVSKNISARKMAKEDVSSTSRLLVEPTGNSTDNIIKSMSTDQQYGSLVEEPKQSPQKIKKKQLKTAGVSNQPIPVQKKEIDQDLRQALSSSTSAIRATNTQTNQSAHQPRNANGALQMMDKAFNQINKSQNKGNQNKYDQQNKQGNNIAFLGNQEKSQEEFKLKSGIEKPVSPYEIFTGGIIPATLQTGIISDLPGQITAKVNRNVFDTVTGNYLLIPQGTTAIGVYSSQVAYGQDRVLFAWKRLVFPNGYTLNLEGMPGADLSGYSGLSDLVNNHYLKMFSSVLLLSVFSAGAQLSQPQQDDSSNTLTNQQILFAAVGQNITQAGAQMLQKDLNIQPTIEIRPGANFNILVTRDMVFPGPYRY